MSVEIQLCNKLIGILNKPALSNSDFSYYNISDLKMHIAKCEKCKESIKNMINENSDIIPIPLKFIIHSIITNRA